MTLINTCTSMSKDKHHFMVFISGNVDLKNQLSGFKVDKTIAVGFIDLKID